MSESTVRNILKPKPTLLKMSKDCLLAYLQLYDTCSYYL